MSLKRKLDDLEVEVVRRYRAMPVAERLRRSLAARAADDRDEADRLRESCEWQDYRMRDAAYTDRIEFANFLAVAAAVDLRHAVGKLMILGLLAEQLDALLDAHEDAALRGFIDGWHAAGGTLPDEAEGDDADEDDAKLPPAFREGFAQAQARVDEATAELRDMVAQATAVAAAGLVAHWRALDRFCRRRMNTPAEVLMRAWGGGVADDTLAHVNAHAAVEPDAEVEARCFEALEAQWAERFGGAAHA